MMIGAKSFYKAIDVVLIILLRSFFLMSCNTLKADWQVGIGLQMRHHVFLCIIFGITRKFLCIHCISVNRDAL